MRERAETERQGRTKTLVEAWCAVLELEAAVAAAAAEALLEELREPAREAALEGVATLLRSRVVRVVAVVEPLTEL